MGRPFASQLMVTPKSTWGHRSHFMGKKCQLMVQRTRRKKKTTKAAHQNQCQAGPSPPRLCACMQVKVNRLKLQENSHCCEDRLIVCCASGPLYTSLMFGTAAVKPSLQGKHVFLPI